MKKEYVIGVDFGSDSVRALVIDAHTGEEISGAVSQYRRWAEGKYSDASESSFRHHPLDYLESLEYVLRTAVEGCPEPSAIKAIGVDTTASTPGLVDENCKPLALREEFKENPDAMFVLWKDHTGQKEADHINEIVAKSKIKYLLHSGNHCSAEYFYPKLMHTLHNSPELQEAAASALELCDWIPCELTGNTSLKKLSMSHCAANIKKMYSPRWNGFPSKEFFDEMDPLVYPLIDRLPAESSSIVSSAGTLTKEWAEKTGLSTDVVVCTGIIDSYSGAIGAGVREGFVVINMGTSQCQMAVRPKAGMTGPTIEGVFGEADDSIIPGYEGLEAGLSAFGDLYAWYKRTLAWPMQKLAESSDNEQLKEALKKAEDRMLADLSEEALKLDVKLDSPLATDYINGRRSPRPNNTLSGAIMGLRISTTAPEIFYAFAEASAFATKAVLDLYINNGVTVNRLIGIGGIAMKSPLVTQLVADITQFPIEVSASANNCALGAAVIASVSAGLYPTVEEAQNVMCPSNDKTYYPNPDKAELLKARYKRYLELADFTERIYGK